MSYDLPGAGAPDYGIWQIDGSRLRFRGRVDPPGSDRIVVLGGDAVFGRYVDTTFCDHVADRLGRSCINLGVPNAGVDMFLKDAATLDFVRASPLCVVQVCGAANLTNRFYAVHPRRNDRVISISPTLRAIYRDVDFTEFHFTRHLLSRLQTVSPARFAAIRAELQRVWIARMRRLMLACGDIRILLWIDHPDLDPLGPDPVFVTRSMLEQVAQDADGVVRVSVPRAGPALLGMRAGQMDGPIAARMIAPDGHAQIAEAVVRAVRSIPTK